MNADQAADSTALARAESLLAVGRPTEAILTLSSVLAQHPDDTAALCLLSRAMREAGRGLEAVQVAARAATNDPDSLPARIELVNALVGIGDTKGSAEQARIVLAMAPQSSTALYTAAYGLSVGTFTLGVAEAVIDRAITLNPNDPDAHNLRAAILWSLGRRRAALNSLAVALSLDPHHPHALANQATFSAARGQFGMSFRAATSGLRSNPAGKLSIGAFREVVTEVLRHLAWVMGLGVVATAAAVNPSTGWLRVAAAGLAVGLSVAYVGWIVRAAPRQSLPIVGRILLRPWGMDLWLIMILAASLVMVGVLALAPLEAAGLLAAIILEAMARFGVIVIVIVFVRYALRRG